MWRDIRGIGIFVTHQWGNLVMGSGNKGGECWSFGDFCYRICFFFLFVHPFRPCLFVALEMALVELYS